VRTAVAALAALVALVALAASASAGAPAPARVQVTAKEFYFILSRRSVVAGPAIVQLVNFGEDPHDLRLQRIGGTHVYKTPQVMPGDHRDLSLALLAGRYRIWCSIANHSKLGMQATLTVLAKKPKS
jgi:plastocyanin